MREFAQARDLTVSIHLLETQTDNTMCTEHAGMNAVDYLDSHGFLWDRVLAVHCVELDDRGQKVLAERGVGVSYNPVSNMRLGSGIAPVPSFLDAGIAVGLGVTAQPATILRTCSRRCAPAPTCSEPRAAAPTCSASKP